MLDRECVSLCPHGCAGTDGFPAWLLWNLHWTGCQDSWALISCLHLAKSQFFSGDLGHHWSFFSAPDSGEVTVHRERQTGSSLRIQAHLCWGSMCDLQGQAPQRKIICLWFMSQALCTLLLSFFRAASNREDISGLARSGRKLWSVEEPDGSKQHSQGIHCTQGSELSWC